MNPGDGDRKNPVRVAGVDGTRGGWVAVVLADDRVVEAQRIEGVESDFSLLADVGVIAIDVPIGFGPRSADALARSKVGGSSVFAIPEREAFEGTYGPGRNLSAQAFALGGRIRHVTELARRDRRFREVHPEVCFWAMNGERRLVFRKKSAGGVLERMALLKEHGITLDLTTLGDVANVPLDDVLDAAACAWTAARIQRGAGFAVSLPDPPQLVEGYGVAIWY
jgi:predicted RNase H-like nuclease